MIYRFQSTAGADVLALGESAPELLQAFGREVRPEGIIVWAELGAARQRLEAAVLADEQIFAQAQAQALAAGEAAPKRPGVSLKQRAWPLLQLMAHSLKAKADLTWRAGT